MSGESAAAGDVVCWASGEIDIDTFLSFQDSVLGALARLVDGERLVLAFDEVTFMDSIGLRIIAIACRRAPGRVVVRGAIEQVVQMLRVSGLTSLLEIESS
jgi:anti-anti-sigma factor